MFTNDRLGLQQRYLNVQYRKNSKQNFILFSQSGSHTIYRPTPI